MFKERFLWRVRGTILKSIIRITVQIFIILKKSMKNNILITVFFLILISNEPSMLIALITYKKVDIVIFAFAVIRIEIYSFIEIIIAIISFWNQVLSPLGMVNSKSFHL